MSDLTSRPFRPNADQCCAACVFGGCFHEAWCPRSLAAAEWLRKFAEFRSDDLKREEISSRRNKQ